MGIIYSTPQNNWKTESKMASAFDLAGCIFPEGKWGPLMFLKIYADESYDALTYCCGGFFGWPKDFYYLGLKWEERLKQSGLTYFHAYDCQQLDGEFSPNSPPGYGYEAARKRADSVRRDLTEIIKGQPILGISLGIAVKDFKPLVAVNPEAAKFYGSDIMIASYKLLIKAAIKLMENDWPEKQYANIKIGFVFDAHSNWKKAEEAYEQVKNEDSVCARRMLVASHGDDKELPGLQMADLAAYECRIRTNEWLKRSAKEREAMKTLRNAHNIYFAGFMGKKELLAEMGKS